MKLTSKASLQIQKPIEEVFESIVNPDKMTNYFISESSGKLETGKEVIWKFPEFKDRFPIKNVVVKTNESISYEWDPETVVNISLTRLPDESTVVRVTEGAKAYNEQNMEWLVSNAAGWANFLACMKAYLEYGIQLRIGAFEFMKEEKYD